MDTEIIDNSRYYKYSENGIKSRNYDLWNSINNYITDDISFKEKFYLYENSLLSKPICYCGNSVKFKDMIVGFKSFCSRRCMYDSKEVKNSRKVTNIEKYGVDNPSKLQIFKDKVKVTNNIKFGVDYPLQSIDKMNDLKLNFVEKYGVDNPSKIKEVREKAENTMLERYGVKHAMDSNFIKSELKEYFIDKYGVDNPSKIKGVREKAENTMLERYGAKHALQNKIILDKLVKTNMDRYGVSSFTKTEEYRNLINDISFINNSEIVNNELYKLISSDVSEYRIYCSKCNSEFTIQRQLFRNRMKINQEICLKCNPILSSSSIDERSLFDFVSSNNTEVISNKRIENQEIDVYLPELKIGFEYNGLYWHSELNKSKKYHLNKSNFFEERGIQLIHIWEDDWVYRKDIVKSIILNKLGKSDKIFARKTKVKEVDNKLVREFLVSNHIQGFVGSNIKIGLFLGDELVSLMTFGNLRKSLGQVGKEGSYELLRFCNKLNTSVVGGASKLFKYFIDNYKPLEVTSYSDSSRSVGGLYEKLGFELDKKTDINYHWSKSGIRYHRFNFRKDKLVREGFDKNKTEVEIMSERGYYRIFDCGNKKWIFRTTRG